MGTALSGDPSVTTHLMSSTPKSCMYTRLIQPPALCATSATRSAPLFSFAAATASAMRERYQSTVGRGSRVPCQYASCVRPAALRGASRGGRRRRRWRRSREAPARSRTRRSPCAVQAREDDDRGLGRCGRRRMRARAPRGDRFARRGRPLGLGRERERRHVLRSAVHSVRRGLQVCSSVSPRAEGREYHPGPRQARQRL